MLNVKIVPDQPGDVLAAGHSPAHRARVHRLDNVSRNRNGNGNRASIGGIFGTGSIGSFMACFHI